MELSGIKNKDKNYNRIIISIQEKTNKESDDFLENQDIGEEKAITNFIRYFLTNNYLVNKIEYPIKLKGYEGKFLSANFGDKNITIEDSKGKEYSKLKMEICDKYLKDREKIAFFNEQDSYDFSISNLETSYILGDEKIDFVFKYDNNGIEEKEVEFITDFIKYRLNAFDEEAIIKHLLVEKEEGIYERTCEHLICGNLKIKLNARELVPIIDTVVREHNNKINIAKQLQLKMEGY